MKISIRSYIAIGALFIAGFVGNILYFMPLPEETIPELHRFPKELGGWHSFDLELIEIELIAIDADETLMRTYVKENEMSTVYIGYHSSGKGGRPSHLPATCYPSSGWQILSSEIENSPIAAKGERENQFNRMLIGKGGEMHLVRYWFQADEKIMATGWKLNTFRIRSRLRRQPYGSAFVRLSTPISNNELEEAEKIIDFWTEETIRFLSDSSH